MIPGVNPLEVPSVLCPTCGEICSAIPVKVGKAKVTEVKWVCVNPETNCGWFVKAALRHAMGEGPYALKPEELKQLRQDRENIRLRKQQREDQISLLIGMGPRIRQLLRELEGGDEPLQEVPPGAPGGPVSPDAQQVAIDEANKAGQK